MPGVRTLGIRIGVGLIEQALYKHANLYAGISNAVEQQAAEDAEYDQRVQSLLRRALQPPNPRTAVERGTKVLSVPQ